MAEREIDSIWYGLSYKVMVFLCVICENSVYKFICC